MKSRKSAKRILLSHGVVGLLTHSNIDLRKDVKTWFARHMALGAGFYLPTLVEYAARTHFHARKFSDALAELDAISEHSVIVPTTAADIKQALALRTRNRRISQKSKPYSYSQIDIVHLIAAQAIRLNAVVATSGNSRINQLVDARHWRTLAQKWNSKVKRWRTVSVAECE